MLKTSKKDKLGRHNPCFNGMEVYFVKGKLIVPEGGIYISVLI